MSSCAVVSKQSGCEPFEVDLDSLSLEAGVGLVRSIHADLSEDDAAAIAAAFNHNPQLLTMVSYAVRCGNMDMEDAKKAMLNHAAGQVHLCISSKQIVFSKVSY